MRPPNSWKEGEMLQGRQMVEREQADTYTHILFCDIYNTFNPRVLKGLIKVSHETLFCANQNSNCSLEFLVHVGF